MICPDCSIEKDSSEFGRASPRCRICAAARTAAKRKQATKRHLERNPGYSKERNKRFYEKNREREKARAARYRADKNPRPPRIEWADGRPTISKALARSQGLKRYFTGEVCGRGHISERQVSSGDCIACGDVRKAKWVEENRSELNRRSNEWYRANKDKHLKSCKNWLTKNPDKHRANVAAWQAANREKCRADAIAWRKANPEKVNATARRWRENNPEQALENGRRWRANNKDKVNAKKARRLAAQIKATPSWADLKKIRAIYAEASRLTRETGIQHHVDHIYPLRSKVMCGLHVETNLQILPAIANQKKSNVTWPLEPHELRA